MKKLIIAVAAILIGAGGLLLSLSPDNFSILILAIMCIVIAFGFFLGLMPAIKLANGFTIGTMNVEQALDIQTSETWIAVFKLESLFQNRELDKIFKTYRGKIEEEKESEEVESDIEEYINEDFLSLRTWQGLILQIPGILTGLGILGTFVGLVTGISSIGFSSVDAAIESINVLLSGIETAFYTSIAGVILSILFNILNRLIWNYMLRAEGVFIEKFHQTVIPSTEKSARKRLDKELKQIITRLDKLPQNNGFSLSVSGSEYGVRSNEQVMMPQVIDGLKNGEFTFYLQPKVALQTKKINSAEALVRWIHPGLGMLTPSTFIPMLEKNGFITKLDMYIWEQVFATLRRWIDSGIRPVPVSVNVSKTDLLAMDVEAFFTKMLDKYRIPPRNLEIEIAKNAFVHNIKSSSEVAGRLRRLGFKVIVDGFDGDYISVNMLENLEVDELKLDLRFMPEHEYVTIESIFEQARKLNVAITVEGIENTEQITYLKRAGCNEAQGFYFYKPMSIESFEDDLE